MSQPVDVAAAEELPAETTAAEAKPAWKLIADAPAPEAPVPPDRAGRARGMLLVLVGGGLFWAIVGAVAFALRG